MKYTINKDISYTFKDVTGLAEIDKIGQSILEGDKVIGGICFHKMTGSSLNVIHLSAIEILPELRGQGKGTEFMKEFLTDIDLLEASAQNMESLSWWRYLGAKEYMCVCYPGEEGKENPRIHTVGFIIIRPILLLIPNSKIMSELAKIIEPIGKISTPKRRPKDNELFQ